MRPCSTLRFALIPVCSVAVLAPVALLAPVAVAGEWERLDSSVYGERYDDLSFVSPTKGWAVNGFGEIWHTDDGGETWELQYDNGTVYFRSIDFADSLVGWAGTVTSSTPLFATKDGGLNWQPVTNLPNPPPVALCGIDAVDRNVMYAAGVWSGPGYILETKDGGATWRGLRLPPVAACGLIDVHFWDARRGMVVGGIGPSLFDGRPVILTTEDGGDQWNVHFVADIPDAWGWKICFPSANVGYVSVEKITGPHYFLKTTDGGRTWQERPFEGGARSQGIGFVTDDIGWIGGPAAVNPTFKTTDGGESWQIDNFGVELNRFQFFGTELGYGAGDYIYRYTDEPVSAAEAPATPPSKPVRSRPNPFHPMTTISYELPRDAHVTLFVADPGGRLVKTLTDAPVTAGPHEVTWDGTNDAGEEVASGLYLYVIRSEALDAIGKLVKVD